MLCKFGGISAMEMLDPSASDALGVKMLPAITACPNVLVNAAFPLLIAEHAQHVPLAKLAKTAIKTASSALGVSVERHAKLLYRKLSVGIPFKKLHEPLTPICVIRFSHFLSLSRNLRIILKL
jgi:hypothetical protein